MVERAELVIAELSFPSTGVGIEMQLAVNKDTPIIICFRNYGSNKVEPVQYENPDHTRHELQVGEGFITLMALGVRSVFKVVQYSKVEEGLCLSTANLRAVETEYSSGALVGGRNGNADVADIALQQLMEVQDS
jgi:hypothetical protein